MLFLDGVYAEDRNGKQRFHRVKAPTHSELNALVHTLSHRIARCLEKRGLLEPDAENTWLTLAVLVPKPRVNLTRVHGVFAPNSQQQVQLTPAKHGKKADRGGPTETDRFDKTPEERYRAMSWMQRLKRVFNIDIAVCKHCAGQVKVIASIEDPAVIEPILKYIKHKTAHTDTAT